MTVPRRAVRAAVRGHLVEMGVVTVVGVPGVVTGNPGQVCGEGREEVVEGPGDYHVVVEIRVKGDQHDGVTYS